MGSPLLRLAVVLAAGFLVGCEHAEALTPDEPDEPAAPTLTRVQAEVFTPSCALSGCHLGPDAPFGLDLSAGQAHASAVGVRSAEVPDLFRIEPGNADASYLVRKIEGGPDLVGSQMPLGRAPLSDAEIALVRAWIEAGAQAD